MTELLCTGDKSRSSTPGYLYLPLGWQTLSRILWEERHIIEFNTITWIWDFTANSTSYFFRSSNTPRDYLYIWKTSEECMYAISHIGWELSLNDGIWSDRYDNPVTATLTTLEELDLYRTFL